MKTKTEAAKLLLEAGWTIEEIASVLELQLKNELSSVTHPINRYLTR